MPRKIRVANTAALRKAKADLDDLYRSLGFDTSKKPRVKKKGLWKPEPKNMPRTGPSDTVPANGSIRTLEMDVDAGLESAETLRLKQAVEKTVAQLYPKGPFGPVSDKDHLKTNMRRNPV